MLGNSISEFIADKSALVRLKHRELEWVRQLILDGKVATCSIINLEIYFSARSYKDLLDIKSEREAAFSNIEIIEKDLERSVEIMTELSKRGYHRSVSIPDLLISALAERNSLVILHYDKDFEFVSKITKQKTLWVAPSGSIP